MEMCGVSTILIGGQSSLYLFDTNAKTILSTIPLPLGPLLSLTLLTPGQPSFFLVHSCQAIYLLDLDLQTLKPLHHGFQNPESPSNTLLVAAAADMERSSHPSPPDRLGELIVIHGVMPCKPQSMRIEWLISE